MDYILDQRNSRMLLEDQEKLARLENKIVIPSYVSWAATNQKLAQVADFFAGVAVALKQRDSAKLEEQLGTFVLDSTELVELSAEIAKMTEAERNHAVKRVMNGVRIISENVLILKNAYNRNVDLGIAGTGDARQEIVNTLTSDRGGILPAEMAMSRNGNGQQQGPSVVVVNANGQGDTSNGSRAKRIRGLG